MMKIIKLQNHLTVILKDGTVISKNDCTDELYFKLLEAKENEDEVLKLIIPEFMAKLLEYNESKEIVKTIKEDLSNSSTLSLEGDKAYIREVSDLIVPKELAEAIIQAEKMKEEGADLLQSYLNFWTLCSLNPNAEARKNLFWFLKKYGMRISKSGLFVTYRNVNLTEDSKVQEVNVELSEFVSEQYVRVKFKLKKSPKNYTVGTLDGNYSIQIDPNKLDSVEGNLNDLYLSLSQEEAATPVYTDAHSGTFKIRIGKIVSMLREQCDERQHVTCSRGLHVAGKEWLAQGYFGQQSIMCLVNPADVVAVPPYDNYGKMRVCAYFPVQLIKRDDQGRIIDEDFPDGFEDDFMHLITYSGTKNNKETSQYTFKIPNQGEIPELNKDNIQGKLEEIYKSLGKKVVSHE